MYFMKVNVSCNAQMVLFIVICHTVSHEKNFNLANFRNYIFRKKSKSKIRPKKFPTFYFSETLGKKSKYNMSTLNISIKHKV